MLSGAQQSACKTIVRISVGGQPGQRKTLCARQTTASGFVQNRPVIFIEHQTKFSCPSRTPVFPLKLLPASFFQMVNRDSVVPSVIEMPGKTSKHRAVFHKVRRLLGTKTSNDTPPCPPTEIYGPILIFFWRQNSNQDLRLKAPPMMPAHRASGRRVIKNERIPKR